MANHQLTCATLPIDKRGKSMEPRIRKQGDGERNKIKEPIKKIPTRNSHYSRNKTLKKYLSPELTLKICTHFSFKGKSQKFKKYLKKRKSNPILHMSFTTKYFLLQVFLFVRKAKIGHKCDSLKVKIETEMDITKKKELKTEHRVHLANLFYKDLKEIDILCKTDNSVEGICFHFQQNMPIPVLPKHIFYSPQIWNFNRSTH